MAKHTAKPRLYLRGKVYWTWYIDDAGRQVRVSTGCRDVRAAEAHARALELRVATGTVIDRSATTLADVTVALIASLKAHNRASGTLVNNERRLGHVARILGARTRLDALTRSDLERFFSVRLKEGVTRSTARAELVALRAALHFAAAHDLYTGQVSRVWPKTLLVGCDVPRSHWLTLPDYHAVLAVADRELPDRADYLRAYVSLGCRKSELYKVRAEHLDHAAHRLFLDGTKTRRAKRWVPVPDPATWSMFTRRAAAVPAGARLFDPWGNAWTQFAAWADRAGVKRFAHNDLRRSTASLLASSGVSSLALSRILGHSTTAMVERVYAQLSDASMVETMRQLPPLAPVPRVPADL